jgi:predicted nuclease of predicted toxin-antitoxin system
MNEYLIDQLRILVNATPGSREYFTFDAHFVPQTDYINNNPKIIILRQERLDQDFACLVRRYGLPPNMAVLSEQKHKSTGTLSAQDLNRTTQRFIERVYAKDFKELGYPKTSELD